MIVMLLLFIAIALGIAFYLYYCLKRMCLTFGMDYRYKWLKPILIIASIGLAVASCNIFSFFGIILLHIIGISLVVRLLNLIIKLIAHKKYHDGFSLWKKIYGSGIIPIVLALIVVAAGYINLNTVTETHYTVYTEKNIRSEGYRVALIADVHFGVSLDTEELLQKCAEISDLSPDLVILCGDIVDNNTSLDQMRQVFAALGSIKSTYGTYFVYGNHDRPMDLVRSDYTHAQLITAIKENDIAILQDNVVRITDDLVLAGREDRSAESRMSIEKLLSDIDKTDFIVTLDHQPSEYEENGKAGTDLLLSGHTHGGQLFPVNLLMKLIPFNDGVYGKYSLSNNAEAIITSGFAGWNYPIKTAAPSEYVIIDIKNK